MIEKFFNVREENIFLKNLFKQITTTLVNLSLNIGFVSLSNLPGDLLVSNSKLRKHWKYLQCHIAFKRD